MLNAGALTFQEFMTRETLPLAKIQNALLEFLCGRDDAVMFGAQAVNAYVKEPRMTQDLDLLSVRADELAQELKDYLKARFHIAVRVRRVGKGRGYRLFQIQKNGSRHLVDLQSVEMLPLSKRIAKVLVAAPEELIARKVIAYHKRRGQPKSGTDLRDLMMLLLRFPELKSGTGPVTDRLKAAKADSKIMSVWRDLVKQEIKLPKEDDKFNEY